MSSGAKDSNATGSQMEPVLVSHITMEAVEAKVGLCMGRGGVDHWE